MLSKAYDIAQSIIQSSNNELEVFKKAGIDQNSIEKAKNLLNHPLAGFALKALGCNKEDLLRGVNNAQTVYSSLQSNDLPTEQAPVSELDRLRENLKRIK